MNHSIDLRQFRYFIALCEELHFGRAAQRLHISQPPLSRQIRQLENQLGVELFLRTQIGVALTPAGIAFLPEARRTLTQAEKAIAIARAANKTNNEKFTLGYTTVFDRSEIPDVSSDLKKHFPNLHVNTQGKHSISLVADIKNEIMDAAFITLHTETLGLKTETIFDDPLVVALSSQHPLARKRKLSFEDINSGRLFWFNRRLNPGYYDYCFSYFAKINFKPEIIPEPADHHMLLGAIAEGQGIALMSNSLQKIKRKGVVFRALNTTDKPISMGIAVAYSEQSTSPFLQTFLELVRAKII